VQGKANIKLKFVVTYEVRAHKICS